MASPNADQAWVQSVCERATPDTTGWPRYQLGNISIAVPPEYKRTRFMGHSLRFIRGDKTTMTVVLGLHSSFHLTDYNLPGQAGCDTHYGGYQTDALSWSGRGEYLAVARWQRLNEPDERPSVQATIRTNRLRDAIALRAALNTIRRLADDANAPSANADAWFYAPCLSDSVDSFDWTRHDLRSIRIRMPRDIRRSEVRDSNELHFRKGGATLRLRLHNDAGQLLAQYESPDKANKSCQGAIGGSPAEMISFRGGKGYGFAARWRVAGDEWLAAVITAPSLSDATSMRRALFTLEFPEKRQPRDDSDLRR